MPTMHTFLASTEELLEILLLIESLHMELGLDHWSQSSIHLT